MRTPATASFAGLHLSWKLSFGRQRMVKPQDGAAFPGSRFTPILQPWAGRRYASRGSATKYTEKASGAGSQPKGSLRNCTIFMLWRIVWASQRQSKPL
jgi:hypothetical protein